MGILNSYVEMPYIIGKCFTGFTFFVCGRVLASKKKLMEFVQKVNDNNFFGMVWAAFLASDAF